MIKEKMVLEEARYTSISPYLKDKDYDNPKEYFKAVGEILSKLNYPAGSRLLDVGCATGKLLYYLKEILPEFTHLEGMDVSKVMIKEANRRVPGVKFFIGSVMDKKALKKKTYDVVTCCGVLQIFDDIKAVLDNLVSCVRDGGTIIVFNAFNDDPVDVLMRYRRVDGQDNSWKRGLNMFSRQTIEDILSESRYRLRWKWHKFHMPFAIKKDQGDPMRAWTISTALDPHQQVNGASQLCNFKILCIKVGKAKKAK